MIIVILFIFGMIFGSFINALVWRLHEKLDKDGNSKKLSKKRQKEMSILYGRSMCPHCRHELAAKDLVPLFSWLWLRGKCRYCGEPIDAQYPFVELATSILFVLSYVLWPNQLNESWEILQLITWLSVLVGLIAAAVYDIKWMLLPDRILSKLALISFFSLIFQVALGRPAIALVSSFIGLAVGGGIFWVLYLVSAGRWIGGGDVKLGFLLGFIVGSGVLAFMIMFIASVIAIVWILPGLLTKKIHNNTKVPFGPFLIAAAFIVMLWGQAIIDWYNNLFTPLV